MMMELGQQVFLNATGLSMYDVATQISNGGMRLSDRDALALQKRIELLSAALELQGYTLATLHALQAEEMRRIRDTYGFDPERDQPI